MRRVMHVSDLHFGSENPRAVRALLDEAERLEPTLVVVSGDLTQRARRREFEAARAFLGRLPAPALVVPGNHDISILDHLVRAVNPHCRYTHLIQGDLDPFYADDELRVAGVNTARALAWKNGRISARQIDRLEAFFCGSPHDVVRILVTHHPFLPRPGETRGRMTPRALRVRRVLHACDVDVLLAGHFHLSYTGHFAVRPGHPGPIVIQAGTAASRRLRRETNAFNVLTIDGPRLALEVHAFEDDAFRALRRTSFARRGGRWVEIGDAAERDLRRAAHGGR